MRGELPGLRIAVSTDKRGLLNFGKEVIRTNKTIVEEERALQKTVSVEKVGWKQVEKKLTQLKKFCLGP